MHKTLSAFTTDLFTQTKTNNQDGRHVITVEFQVGPATHF